MLVIKPVIGAIAAVCTPVSISESAIVLFKAAPSIFNAVDKLSVESIDLPNTKFLPSNANVEAAMALSPSLYVAAKSFTCDTMEPTIGPKLV